jgi:putative aminopeptidase FrvX
VQEEFNLRGAVTAAQVLQPDIAIQIDLILAADTPDMAGRGDVTLGGGSRHGDVLVPRPRHAQRHDPASGMVRLFEETAAAVGVRLQKSAHIGCLTDSSYVQLVGQGVASIDMGFPMRYSHSALELCDLADLEELTRLLVAGIAGIGPEFSLDRDDFEQ